MHFEQVFKKAVDSYRADRPATAVFELKYTFDSKFEGATGNVMLAGDMLLLFGDFLMQEGERLRRDAENVETPDIGRPAVLRPGCVVSAMTDRELAEYRKEAEIPADCIADPYPTTPYLKIASPGLRKSDPASAPDSP